MTFLFAESAAGGEKTGGKLSRDEGAALALASVLCGLRGALCARRASVAFSRAGREGARRGACVISVASRRVACSVLEERRASEAATVGAGCGVNLPARGDSGSGSASMTVAESAFVEDSGSGSTVTLGPAGCSSVRDSTTCGAAPAGVKVPSTFADGSGLF
jgi:hypothetical protein